jgi:hypothetical protein
MIEVRLPPRRGVPVDMGPYQDLRLQKHEEGEARGLVLLDEDRRRGFFWLSQQRPTGSRVHITLAVRVKKSDRWESELLGVLMEADDDVDC